LDHPLIDPVVWLSRLSVRGREVSARRVTSAVAASARDRWRRRPSWLVARP